MLPPHSSELQACSGSPDAVVQIVELTSAAEAAPGAVWAEVAEMGFLCRRGETFPYWPAWLDDGEVGLEGDC